MQKQKQAEFEEMNSVHSMSQSNSSPQKMKTMRPSNPSKQNTQVGSDSSPFAEAATIDLNLDDNVDFLNPTPGSRTSSDASKSKSMVQKPRPSGGKFGGKEEKKAN